MDKQQQQQCKGFTGHVLSRSNLPCAWQTEVDGRGGGGGANALRHLDVSELRVKYIGPGNDDADAASIRANHPVPKDCPMYYFEITVLNAGSEGLIGMQGFLVS